MPKIQLSEQEIAKQFSVQLQMLKEACARFDDGNAYEAQNIARVLRILLRKNRNSHPLLEQVGRWDTLMMDSTTPDDNGNLASYHGLIGVALANDGFGGYVADLDAREPRDWLPIDQWWKAIVFRTQEGVTHTREQAVLTLADQDGGAHVDPGIEEDYYNLSRRNSLKWFSAGPAKPMGPLEDPHLVSVRQIGHEVIRSLDPDYRRFPKDMDVTVISGFRMHEVAMADLTDSEKIQLGRRNRLCECTSGKRFKHCCGRLSGLFE